MNSHHNSNDKHRSSSNDQYSDAGAQAAQVFGELMSMANEFSKKFDRGFSASAEATVNTSDSRSGHQSESLGPKNDSQYHSDQVNADWQKAGEYLRELREAAGYTIDGFAKALNRQDAEKTVKAAEGGREVFPQDWFDQAVEILRHRDPLEFFDRLKDYYEPSARNASSTSAGTENLNHAISARQEKMQAIFSDQDALNNLTESQFEEVTQFVQSNYQSALQLLKKQS